jgi:hypothetical protein
MAILYARNRPSVHHVAHKASYEIDVSVAEDGSHIDRHVYRPGTSLTGVRGHRLHPGESIVKRNPGQTVMAEVQVVVAVVAGAGTCSNG